MTGDHSQHRSAGTRRRLAVCLAIGAAVFFGTLSVLRSVYLYGDDFFYSSFTAYDWKYFAQHHFDHYFRANGRVLVHLLATVFLRLPRLCWQLLEAGMLTAIAWLSARLAAPDERRRPWAFLLTAGAIFALNITLTRQSVYWVTGSFNYVWPVLLLLIFWTRLERAVRLDRAGWGLPVLALLAGATVEQAGMMAFGATTLAIARVWLIGRRRPRAAMLASLLTSAAGIATVVLSPSVKYRAAMEDAPAVGFLNLLRYNLGSQARSLLYSNASTPYWTLVFASLLLAFAVWGFSRPASTPSPAGRLRTERPLPDPSRCRPLMRAVFLILALECGAWLFRLAATRKWIHWTGGTLLPNAIDAVLIVDLLTALLLAGWISFCRTGSAVPLTAAVLAFGAQAMMLVSPVYGARNLLCSLITLTMAACLCLDPDGSRSSFEPFMAGQDSAHSPAVGSSACSSAAVAGSSARLPAAVAGSSVRPPAAVAAATLALLFFLGSLPQLEQTREGYAANVPVWEENLSDIRTFLAEGGTGICRQRRLPDEAHAWAMPYHNAYYDPYYNIAFGLPDHTKIEWSSP